MTPEPAIAPPASTGDGVALSGEQVVIDALSDALVHNRPADAAKRFFTLKSRHLATDGLTALIDIGASALREMQRSDVGPVDVGIDDLVERAQLTAPITRWETDVPLFWELLQFTGCLAGGVRLSPEGLALRYTGEQLLFGAFVVAVTLLQLAGEHLGGDAVALERALGDRA